MYNVSTEIVWGSIITAVIVFVLHYYVSRIKYWSTIAKIPGPPTWPIVGNALDYIFIDHTDLSSMYLNWGEMYPKMFKIWLLGYPYLIIFAPDEVEALVSNPVHNDKSNDYRFLQPWLGTGLLTSNASKWHLRRKLLTPAFHFRILEDFIPVFNDQSEILIEKLMNQTEKKSFDIVPLITMCTLDIICDSVMGCHVNAQNDSESTFVLALEKIKEIVYSRMINILLWPDWLFPITPSGREHAKCLKVLHGFTDKVIQERKIKLKSEGKPTSDDKEDSLIGRKKRLAFLDLLIEASDEGRQLSDLDIREEVDTFMFEGHDTTAIAISWCLYFVALFPHIQKKMHDELDSIFEDDRNGTITFEHIQKMKYLECVIKEALRFTPSVPTVARNIKEDTVIGSYTIPAGMTAVIIFALLHRNPDTFPEPDWFNPDRFLPENSQNRHPYGYAPFSAGSRNCIGQRFALLEEKVVLAWILRSFKIETRQTVFEIKVLPELIMRPKDGILISLTPR